MSFSLSNHVDEDYDEYWAKRRQQRHPDRDVTRSSGYSGYSLAQIGTDYPSENPAPTWYSLTPASTPSPSHVPMSASVPMSTSTPIFTSTTTPFPTRMPTPPAPSPSLQYGPYGSFGPNGQNGTYGVYGQHDATPTRPAVLTPPATLYRSTRFPHNVDTEEGVYNTPSSSLNVSRTRPVETQETQSGPPVVTRTPIVVPIPASLTTTLSEPSSTPTSTSTSIPTAMRAPMVLPMWGFGVLLCFVGLFLGILIMLPFLLTRRRVHKQGGQADWMRQNPFHMYPSYDPGMPFYRPRPHQTGEWTEPSRRVGVVRYDTTDEDVAWSSVPKRRTPKRIFTNL